MRGSGKEYLETEVEGKDQRMIQAQKRVRIAAVLAQTEHRHVLMQRVPSDAKMTSD